MIGISEKINRAIRSMQYRLHDNWVNYLGSSVNTFLIDMEQDKYQNREYILRGYESLSVIVNFPGNEIPISSTGNGTNSSPQVLHLYSILPITAIVPLTSKVKVGNIFFYKYKLTNGEYQVLILQFLEILASANRVTITNQEWVVAPVVDFAIINNPAFQNILAEYKANDNW